MNRSTPSSSPFSALVVDPNDLDLAFVASTLSSAGFAVTTTNNFHEARAILMSRPPLLLISEIRLGAYNGLQLALRGRSTLPRMTIVLTSTWLDPVLQRDADQVGATFVLKPVSSQELLAAVYRMALRRPRPDGSFEPVRPPFERRRKDRRQTLTADFEPERRRGEQRRDIPGLLLRTVDHS